MLSAGSPEDVLSFFVANAAKATILLGCAAVAAWAIRRSSAAIRHHIWAAAILSSLLLPVLALLLPGWRSAVLGNATAGLAAGHGGSVGNHFAAIPSITVRAITAASVSRQVALLVFTVWMVGFLAGALRIAVGLCRLALLSRRAKPLFEETRMSEVLRLGGAQKISRSVRLLESSDPKSMPLTWGVFRPVIILPANTGEWCDERRRIVLSHELAHIARSDWFLQICAELARALYWFHPMAWLAAARLRQESERACDDAVLLSGVAPSDYASQLLDLARTMQSARRAWSTALAIARLSNLERRFAAMLNPTINRKNLSWRTKFLVPVLAVLILLPLAALRMNAQNLSGKVSGTIHDPSGTGVANATIIMSNGAAKTIDMTTSDREGNFSFKALPAGEYEMKTVKLGFEVYQIPVTLESGRDFSQAVMLKLGSITERLEVTPNDAEKPRVEGSSGKVPRLRLGGNVEAAHLIKKVQPIYPEAARSAGISGTVILHAVIGTDGEPLALRVVNSEVDPDLARSAVQAVVQWRYSPTLLNGEAVEIDTTIQVVYSLEP